VTRTIAGEIVFIVLAMVLGFGALTLARPGESPPATPSGPASNAPLTATVAPAVTFTPQSTATGTVATAQPTGVLSATTSSTPSPVHTSDAVVSVTPSTAPAPTLAPTATVTPRPTTRPTPIPTPVPTPIVYVVQAGDSLDAIARKFGVSVDALSRANRIGNPDQLAQGQKLIIPRR
jgi:LysM repeat protein